MLNCSSNLVIMSIENMFWFFTIGKVLLEKDGPTIKTQVKKLCFSHFYVSLTIFHRNTFQKIDI